jgi:hypothetical protein
MSYAAVKDKEQLDGTEKLTKDELEMLMDLDEEFMRRGHFNRIFPSASLAFHYENFFEYKRYQNVLVAAYLNTDSRIKEKLLAKHKRVYFSDV